MLTEKETWSVTDSTKLQCYMTCPRMYFFQYVLGWKSATPSIHLHHGTSIHKALERFYRAGAAPDYSDVAVAEACLAYLDKYREVFPESEDDMNEPKNPACTFRALQMYADFYRPIDEFEVLHTEVAGSVLITEKRTIHFKQDVIARDLRQNRVFSLEHKTGTDFRPVWARDWEQKVQTGVYSHVLYCMFPVEEVFGVHINGIFIRKPPQMKLDGSPRANSRDTEFHRVPVGKSLALMQDWALMVDHWMGELEEDFDKLSFTTDSEEFLEAFPKNSESCSKYFGCIFQPYCSAWTNPLRRCDEPPVGFIEEHWDPRSEQQKAKEVVEL